ncbi:MAG: aminopeptidase N [Gammaproteobacteria bacterium]
MNFQSYTKRVINRLLGLVIAGTLLCTITGCENTPMTETITRIPEGRLTHEYAKFRSERISDVRYDLRLSLEDSDDLFSGEVIVDFALAAADQPISLDFADGSVETLAVNGVDIAIDYNQSFLNIPADTLRVGANTVHVVFLHEYSHSGQGLHRFVDPEDKQVYLHTHFEPYDANRLFPCFDQPDLRARYRLQVRAPAHWEVISATREAETSLEGELRTWYFPETQPFSTYIFPLHAGEYEVWEDNAGDIPLRLFARQSLARHVRPDDWFKLTRQGMAFFQDYFDLPYPYGKYDQLIVPEFNIGGMENVGAVTYTESFIRRGEYTREDMERLANTLLHELSHMWFGDLVTPAWWDGLWLKEAFATYMGYLAQAEATEYSDAWHFFFMNAKRRAYVADQLVTTHPIQVDVDDTHYAVNNFDDITYRKGASVLTQLSHFVGDKAFRDGTRIYLERFANGTTELADFISALEEASGLNLTSWVETWLRTAGLNTVTTELSCVGGAIESLTLIQSAPGDYPVLRDHRVQLALFNSADRSGVTKEKVIPVTLSGERTLVDAAVGVACPELIYPNFMDWGFVKVQLDAVTLSRISLALPEVADPLLRSMLWQSLWEMVRDATLSLDVYLDMVLDALPGESNEKVAGQVAETLSASLGYLWQQPPEAASFLASFGPRLEQLAWREAERAEPGSDFQTLWLDTFRRLSHTEGALQTLRGQLTGEAPLPVSALDQDRRWLVVARLNAFDSVKAVEIAKSEREKDPSDTGMQMFIASQAARPSIENKKKWLEAVRNNDSELSLRRRRSIMGWLFPEHQQLEQAALSEDILDSLDQIGRDHEDAFLTSYGGLIPRLCTAENVSRLKEAREAYPDLHPILMKRLRVALQEDQRCLAISRQLGG